jgi:outer membrane PBP1 activator LpoA protein
MGCHSGPVRFDDAAYRSVEREVDRNLSALAVTSVDIAAHAERIDDRAARVQSDLNNLETGIGESTLPGDEKSALLLHASRAREESGALIQEVSLLRENTLRLNDQLTEQREINAALSVEHDNRESAGAAVQMEAEKPKEKLTKVKRQRNICAVMLISGSIAVIGYIAFRVLRFLQIIPV